MRYFDLSYVAIVCLLVILTASTITIARTYRNVEIFRLETARRVEIFRLANEVVRKKIRDGEYESLEKEVIEADIKFYIGYFAELNEITG